MTAAEPSRFAADGSTGKAAGWILLYLILTTAPLVVLLIGPVPPQRGFWRDFSASIGFSGMAILAVQFAMTARFRRMTAPFGIDIIYYLHRYLAILALGLVLAHFGVLYVAHQDLLGELDPRRAPVHLTLGRVALLCFFAAVVTSQWRKLLRIDYDWWRVAHVLLAVIGFAAAVGHILGVGYYTGAPLKRALWLGLTGSWVLLILWVRIVKPWMQRRRPYRVAAVREERGGAVTLALAPDGHEGFRHLPGQFAWLTLRRSPFQLREHPFTIASPPEQGSSVEFTIKPLGDFTSGVSNVQVGETAFLDGPYGVFSFDRQERVDGFAFIVGGVGVTPAMSMLRSLASRGDRRPLWLIYANGSWEEVIFREEIDSLTERLNLELTHVLASPPEGWTGETGYVDQAMLDRCLPKTGRERIHYFLCGPAPMLSAVDEALSALGVPARRRQVEIFDMA